MELITKKFKMITSNQINLIVEKYLDIKAIRNQKVVVYENPTPSDIKEMATEAIKENRRLIEIRYIAMVVASQKVYVWDAYLATHEDVARSYGIDLRLPNVVYGEISINNGRIDTQDYDIAMSIGSIRPKGMRDFLAYNWDFLDKYFGSKFSNKINTFRKAYL